MTQPNAREILERTAERSSGLTISELRETPICELPGYRSPDQKYLAREDPGYRERMIKDQQNRKHRN